MAPAKNSSILLVFLLLLVERSVVNGSHHRRLLLGLSSDHSSRSITISGTVFCDTCHERHLSESSIIFKDAKVLVECDSSFSEILRTDDKGQYTMQLHRGVTAPKHCKSTLLSSTDSALWTSCSTTLSYHLDQSQVSKVQDLIFKPKTSTFCPRREALSLGPPDPPQPSSEILKTPPAAAAAPKRSPETSKALYSTSEASKKVESYHLGPPDPPRPTGANNGRPRHG